MRSTNGVRVLEPDFCTGVVSEQWHLASWPLGMETRENSNLLELEMSNVIRKLCRTIVEQLAAKAVPQASFMRKGEQV
jgi:hypothetical protein